MVPRINGLWISVVLAAGCGDDGSATGVDPGETATAESSGGGSTGDLPTTGPATAASSDSSPGTDGETGGVSSDAGSSGAASTSGGEPTTADATSDGSTGEPDPSAGTTGDEPLCPPVMMHLPCDGDSDDPLHAIGLGCTTMGLPWLDKQTATAVDKLEFVAAPAQDGRRPWQVARAYGSFIDPDTQAPFWSAREGEKVLLISSGLLPAPDGDGAVIIAGSEVYNDVGDGKWDENAMPPPMSPKHGSPDPQGFKECDGVGDCSNTLATQWELGGGDPNDRLWLRFEVTAPPEANGYSFDFAFFSAEFPEWVDTAYNDIFVVWQSSESYTGNVTFIAGQPLTVTALWPIEFQGECNLLDPDCQGEDPHLDGTGHSKDGGATGWYRATGGVVPGETFGLSFAIFDMGDSTYDTTAIVDRWQWDCEGCVPGDGESCGVVPQ